MTVTNISPDRAIQTDIEQIATSYYDQESDLSHDHLGVGEFDPAVLALPGYIRDALITAEVQRMETAQVGLILDALGPVRPTDRLLDAGCGRGGTSVMIHERFGCRVDGVSLSTGEVDFAAEQAEHRGCAAEVQFHHRDMCATGFPDGSFDHVVANETDMYVDLHEAYREVARVLAPGGRFVLVTLCCNDALDPYSAEAREIDAHHPRSHTKPRSHVLDALTDAGLAPRIVRDVTEAPLEYLQLRAESAERTGVEKSYYEGFTNGTIAYLTIVAERVR